MKDLELIYALEVTLNNRKTSKFLNGKKLLEYERSLNYGRYGNNT